MTRKAAVILSDMNIRGGIQTVALSIVKALTEIGFEVDVICTNIDWNVVNEISLILGIKPGEVKFKLLRLPPILPRTIHTSTFSKLINTMLHDYQVTINAHGDVQLVPADIVYFHQFNVDYNFNASKLLGRALYAPLWLRRRRFLEALKDSKSIILVNSRWTLAEARVFWKLKNVRVLHPPIINYEELHEYANKPRRQDIVLTISRFSRDRGLERILDLAKKIPEAKFIIAGYVQDKQYFIEIYKHKPHNLFLYPNVSEKEKLKLFSYAKVYVNPTPYIEGFGIAVAEAMATGLIPITSDKGGVRDFVPKEYRLIDPNHMVEAVREALQQWNKELAVKISKSVGFLSLKNFKKNFMDYIVFKTI